MHGEWFPALRFEAHLRGFHSDRKTTQRSEGNPRFLEMTLANMKMKMKMTFALLTCSLVHVPLTAGHKWAVVGQFKGPFPRRATHCTDNQRYMVQGTLPSLEKCKCVQILPHEKMQIISLCSKMFTLKHPSVQHVYGRLTENGKMSPDENLSYELKNSDTNSVDKSPAA